MKRPIFRISLLSILLMPICFAAGWFVRDWTFEREVQKAAHQIVAPIHGEQHITYVPELGIIFRPPKELVERKDEIAKQTPEQIKRRMEFFNRLRRAGFGSKETIPGFVTQRVRRSE